MAHQWMRCNLSAAQYPFQTDLWGRTIVVPQYDQNYERQLSGTETASSKGLPQAFYMHNCVPTTHGYQAVGYDTVISGISGETGFDTVFELLYSDPTITRVLFAPVNGRCYIYDATVGSWQLMTAQGLAGYSATPDDTTADVTDLTIADMSWKLPNSYDIVKLGMYSNTAVSSKLFILKRNSAGNFTVEVTLDISHTGAGWEDFSLTTAFAVPATGDYYVAAYGNTTGMDVDNATDRASVSGVASGTQTWTETTATDNILPVRAICTVVIPQFSATTLVTTATVSGQTYICLEGIGVFIYDVENKQLFEVVLAGLEATAINGICTAQGYMVAWDDVSISWSNVSNPTDFVPSLTTGAGGGSVQYARGRINFCANISNGFMIYCEQNVVSALYSSNVRYPFVFKEVSNSGGCADPEQVSYQSNNANHYAWTTAGLQELTKDSAATSKADVTDFLASKVFEDFDEATKQITVEYLEKQLAVKVAAVSDRYIIISYGKTSAVYTHALWYDTALKRWGKLKLDHRKFFEWPAPSLYGEVTYGNLSNVRYTDMSTTSYDDLATGVDIPEMPRENIAVLLADGSIKTLNFDVEQSAANGVLMLGKFQFVRNRFITHQLSDIENVKGSNNFQFYLIPTLDGKTMLPAVATTLLRQSEMSRRYGCLVTGQNVTALFMGAFNLTAYMLNFTLGGEW